MLGLSNASLENFTRTQTKCILTSQSSRTRYELIGTTQVDNDKSLRHMTLVCPAIGPLLSDSESIPSREVMSVDVSFNGYNMMRCGEIEFFPPCMTRIAPTCGPKGRPTSIEVFGEYFYNEMSKSICVSDTDRLIISANYRDQTKSLQFNRPDIPLAAASPPSSVISISFGDKSLPYMLYDEPTSMKIEPNSGSALGGYVVKINGKGLFSSTSLSIRITAIGGATLPGKVYVVPGTLTAEPNAKTGLGTVSFTMAAMENGEKSGSIEISFNEVDYTSCSEQPFIFK
uniref:IPT/TIG domain-containing protein n=1 Tax=Spongospora subterranea TaxID=70186 RepID=A0A0H5QY05_9EUKA|eukprot:CRZ06531.1 hypothetical protein [Spongospora subterranea]